jgi:hypothetical protein
MILIQEAGLNLKSLRMINETRLRACMVNRCFGVVLGSMGADQHVVLVSIVKNVHIPAHTKTGKRNLSETISIEWFWKVYQRSISPLRSRPRRRA